MGLGSKIALLLATVVAERVINFVVDEFINDTNNVKIDQKPKEKYK